MRCSSPKNKTQSAIRDAQSGIRDCGPKIGRQNARTVRYTGPSASKSTIAQSATPDTSNIPGIGKLVDGPLCDPAAKPKSSPKKFGRNLIFGDDARDARISRH
jgi:hypothetical protein